MTRQYGNADYRRLKVMFRQLIKDCGGLCEAAKLTRVEKSALGTYGNVNCPDSFPPIDVVMDLEGHTGSTTLSRYMQSLVEDSQPPAKQMANGDMMALGAHLLSEMAEFQEAAVKAIEDGRVDDGELAELIKEAGDVLHAGHRLSDALERERRRRQRPVHEVKWEIVDLATGRKEAE